MDRKVRVGLIGSGFVSSIHAESLARCSQAQLWAVASPTPGNAAQLAARYDIPHALTDFRKLLALDEIDLVVIGAERSALPDDDRGGRARQARRRREAAVP